MSSKSDNDSERTVLLTGATGFVGTHVARLLHESGFKVRCLVRPTSDRSRLPAGVKFYDGHVLNYESLRRAVEGCWGTLHVAGIIRSRKQREFYRVNGDGTANVARASREADAQRFILCSSLAAAGPSTSIRRRKADDPPNPITDYGKSKLAGENALRENAGNMWYAILRPPVIYGPYDRAFLGFVKWVKLGIKVRLGGYAMPFSVVHISDLARAFLAALDTELPPGKAWFIADGAEHYLEDVAEAVEAALGKEAHWVTIPRWVMPLVAEFNEAIAGIRGEEAILGRRKYAELTQSGWTCDDNPFREAAGWKEEYDLARGMKDTIDWYLNNGWL